MATLTTRLLTAALLFVSAVSTVQAQIASISTEQATSFMGTWAFTMTEPQAFKGTQQTVRIWNENGDVAASFQVGKFPPTTVTGIYRDGSMLILTVGHHATPGLRENGTQIWAVISLTPDGDGLLMFQMLEQSETIKKGIGRKLPNP